MDTAEKHYPPGADPEPTPPASEQPIDAPTPETPPAPEPKDDAPKTEDTPQTPPANTDDDPKDPPEVIKPRSIYDDYKDKKQEAKDLRAIAESALRAQGIELTGKETPAELQALLETHTKTPPPEPPTTPVDNDLKEFAQQQGLEPEGLEKLVSILEKRLGRTALPEEVSKEIADLRTKVESREQADRRAAEDQSIRDQSPAIKAQLKELGSEVHDDGEFSKVMNEVIRLSHTKDFHDKEVAYIIWSKRAELSKLISPKKPSFEAPSANRAEGEAQTVDFTKGGVTPEQAQAAKERPRSTYTVSHAK